MPLVYFFPYAKHFYNVPYVSLHLVFSVQCPTDEEQYMEEGKDCAKQRCISVALASSVQCPKEKSARYTFVYVKVQVHAKTGKRQNKAMTHVRQWRQKIPDFLYIRNLFTHDAF